MVSINQYETSIVRSMAGYYYFTYVHSSSNIFKRSAYSELELSITLCPYNLKLLFGIYELIILPASAYF